MNAIQHTKESNCKLPANDRCLDIKELILPKNLPKRLSQSTSNNLEEIRRTPRYLTESFC
jgi:hypothetical protein